MSEFYTIYERADGSFLGDCEGRCRHVFPENEIIDVEDLQLSQSTLTEEALDFDEQERKINRERILWALKQCNGIKRDAAKMLEMSHTTFYARMKEYGIPTNKL